MRRPSQVTTATMKKIIKAIHIKGINKVSFIAVVFCPNFYDNKYFIYGTYQMWMSLSAGIF
jgi:hypothetical protein